MRYILLLLIPIYSFCQDSTQTSKAVKEVEMSTLLGETTPFWLRANQYGTLPNQSPALIIRAIISKETSLKNKNWQIGYGIEAVGYVGKNNDFILPQAYLQASFKKWELYVGRKKEIFGLCDSTLGTGSYSWSGNALPIPKIQLSVPDYRFLRFTKNWVAIKGSYAHGWFGSEQWVQHYFLHQKTLYLRIAKPNSKLKLYGGFVHNAQWGGRATYDSPNIYNRKLPQSFRDYLYTVTGRSLQYSRVFGPVDTTLREFDTTNRIGNHLGTVDIGFDYDFENYAISFYRQNIFEDGSLYYLINIADGLNGLSIRKKNFLKQAKKLRIEKLNFEFLYTLNQGGPKQLNARTGAWGKDNYFNHTQFRDGWYYSGRIIGTPFITNRHDMRATFQENVPFSSFENANNNRVKVLHLGLEGYYGNDVHFISKLSYSNNYGTYDYAYQSAIQQFSALLQVDGHGKWLKGSRWIGALAWDSGKLYNNSLAIKLSLVKKL